MIAVGSNVGDEIRKALNKITRAQSELNSARKALHELMKMSDEGRLIVVEPEDENAMRMGNNNELRDGEGF